MANIISIEAAKRGTSQIKVETKNGDTFIIGFSSTDPAENKSAYSTIICNILDDFDKKKDGDMFSYISIQMSRAKMESPLYLMPDRNDERTRIGRQIRSIREQKSMDAKTLARLTDIDPANLSRIESGKFSAGLDTLSKIAMALDSKVEIVQNPQSKIKGFSMKRNIWVLPTKDFCPYALIPVYGYIYWPAENESDIRIGDIIVTYYDEHYSTCFIVSETTVDKDPTDQEFREFGFPGPLNRPGSYMKLNYHTGLTSTEEGIIINNAEKQIKGEPADFTLLEGDIL